MQTLTESLARRAAGIAWRNAAREAITAGRRFLFIPA
jgi:hypothetical protein